MPGVVGSCALIVEMIHEKSQYPSMQNNEAGVVVSYSYDTTADIWEML